ncbi:MAG: NADPH:quinone reductase [Pseudonocardiales bacterium]|jgi:NADPH:quinone reductase-like Zn-dependent oxidoreductase|nr:NADPH:quinone reductase [Pseudonocardiales bacterium]
MTRQVVATGFGGPEVLQIAETEVPAPGVGEVRLAVRAIGVNPADVKMYSGAFGADPAALPIRLGYEAAGVVSEVGPGVTTFRAGDEVIAYRANGAYASDIVVAAEALSAKPPALGWPEAGGLSLAGATAVHALRVVSITGGDTVLVHGAAGGVGLLAVQLAAVRGARVIGTASAGKHDLLRSLGTEPVEYGPGLADRVRALAPGGVQAAVDTVGTDEAVDVSLELVADRARIVTIAAFARAAAEGIALVGAGPGADPGTEVRNAARPELARLAAEGTLRVIVARTYSLDDVAEAHREIAAGHVTGKLVLVP